MSETLRGTGTALVTPMNEACEIDFDALGRLLDYNADNGVDYFVVNGTTGESATTNKTEKHQLLKYLKEKNKKNLPIVYGTGGYDTLDIIDHVKTMDWEGVTALLSVSPYYNKPSQKGIIAHYKAVADACPVPVILYNVPGRTASNLTAETTLQLAEHENIIGIKEASSDFSQIVEILAHKPKDFILISGDDLCTVPMISIGAEGVISVLANAYPAQMSTMVNKALAGDFEGAMEILGKFTSINDYMYSESSPVGIKELLKLIGICDNHVRLPLVKGSDALVANIKANMLK